MKLSTSLLFWSLCASTSAIVYNSNEAGTNNFKDLVFKHRFYVPYGPDLTIDPDQPSNEIWEGYGFGMGAAEHAAYDYKEGYMYIQSEEGPYISVTDWSSDSPKLTSFSLDLSSYDDSDLKDVVVCPEQGYIFIAATDANLVLQYSTVKRDNPNLPQLIREIDAGSAPDNLRASVGCEYVAVANENDGESFAEGSVHLISNLDSNSGPSVTKISLAGFDDDYLLSNGVAMPLSKKAMEYWDDHSDIADDLNLGLMRAEYKPSYFFMPEYMKFSNDNKKLFVNLQDNSALVQIDTASAEAKRIDGYGLKRIKDIGFDLVEDDGCSEYVNGDNLYAMRLPDTIDNLELDGEMYIFTADEGTDFDFDDYEEKFDAGDVFDGNSIALKGFTAPTAFFDTSDASNSPTARFNKECENYGTFSNCLDGVEISVGSEAVDYTNPEAPVIDKLVLFGGRGMSVYKVPESYDSPIEFVWDSGDDFEKEGCQAFPWAHNGVQDEDFAPTDGARYIVKEDERGSLDEMNDPNQDGCEDDGTGNPGACPMPETIDEKSPKRGMEPEVVIVAVACDRALALSCGENNGDCFLYDVTDLPNAPVLKKTFNLSPISETLAPGPAYKARTLGDLDPEASFFVTAEQSPSGKAGIFFGGAHSGTMSFWEFECTTPVEAVERTFGSSQSNEDSTENKSKSLSPGGIAGIVIACIALVAFIVYIVVVANRKKDPDIVIVQKDSGRDEEAVQ